MRVQAPTWQPWVDGGAVPSADKVAPLCLSVPRCVLSGDCSALVFASPQGLPGRPSSPGALPWRSHGQVGSPAPHGDV